MRRGRALALAAGCLVLAGPTAGRCDDAVFVTGGLGAGSVGLGGTASLNIVHGKTLCAFRVASLEEFNIFGPSPNLSATDFGVMIGRASRSRHGLSYAAAGVGLVHSVTRGRLVQPGVWFFGPEYERIERTTVGIPVELGAIAHVGVIGIGVSLFGDINPAQSFVGLALTVPLGKLR